MVDANELAPAKAAVEDDAPPEVEAAAAAELARLAWAAKLAVGAGTPGVAVDPPPWRAGADVGGPLAADAD